MPAEFPTMASATRSSLSYTPTHWESPVEISTTADAAQRIGSREQFFNAILAANATTVSPQKETPMTTARRFVKIIIIDPDENVPLDKALLYNGEEKFTDLSDQELFFEIDIKSILERHNAVRANIRNKKVKERDEMLEPARIRDLKMTVVSIATF